MVLEPEVELPEDVIGSGCGLIDATSMVGEVGWGCPGIVTARTAVAANSLIAIAILNLYANTLAFETELSSTGATQVIYSGLYAGGYCGG